MLSEVCELMSPTHHSQRDLYFLFTVLVPMKASICVPSQSKILNTHESFVNVYETNEWNGERWYSLLQVANGETRIYWKDSKYFTESEERDETRLWHRIGAGSAQEVFIILNFNPIRFIFLCSQSSLPLFILCLSLSFYSSSCCLCHQCHRIQYLQLLFAIHVCKSRDLFALLSPSVRLQSNYGQRVRCTRHK